MSEVGVETSLERVETGGTAAVVPGTGPIEAAMRVTLTGAACEMLEALFPVEEPVEGVPVSGKYSPRMHAELCRMKLLGLSNRAAAEALGVSPNTLVAWRQRYPKLAVDMESASNLAVAHVARLLHAIMIGGGKDAFNAVKFFLSTHSPDFQEKQKVEVTTDPGDTMRDIRANLYGLGDVELAVGDDKEIEDASAPLLTPDLLGDRDSPLIEGVSAAVLPPVAGEMAPPDATEAAEGFASASADAAERASSPAEGREAASPAPPASEWDDL